jgi:hypothetical protein
LKKVSFSLLLNREKRNEKLLNFGEILEVISSGSVLKIAAILLVMSAKKLTPKILENFHSSRCSFVQWFVEKRFDFELNVPYN